MSDLTRRVIRLKRRTAERRCAICRERSPTRVAYVEADREDEPAVPEHCPVCGWEPLTIRVEYVDGDGWRDTA